MKIKAITNAMRKILPLGYCGAVIVAAGNASRMGGIDKMMAPICGKAVITHTVQTFQDLPIMPSLQIMQEIQLRQW